MALEAAQQLGQGRRMARLIVETAEEDVLKTDPPSGDLDVAAAVLQQGLDRVGMGRGDQLFAQPLIRCMQAHGQGELGAAEAFQGQLRQPRQRAGNPDRAHRDLPLGHAQVRAEAINRVENRLHIEQGFAHAHEHHVARALVHDLPHAQHLIHDFVDGQGALQAPFASGAEATGHGTAHLTADADGQAALGGNADGLDAQLVVGAQQQLGGAIAGDAAVDLPRTPHPIEGARRRLRTQGLAEGLRQDRHLVEGARPLGVEPVMQLAATEGGLTMLLSPMLQSREAHPQEGTGLFRWRRGRGHQPQASSACPSLYSTASRAKKPSIATRPFSRSVWVWKP